MRAILLCTACVVISGLLIALMAEGPQLGFHTPAFSASAHTLAAHI